MGVGSMEVDVHIRVYSRHLDWVVVVLAVRTVFCSMPNAREMMLLG